MDTVVTKFCIYLFQIQCQKGQSIFSAVSPIIDEFSLANPKLYLAGSSAAVEVEANAVFLYDNILIIEDRDASSTDEVQSTYIVITQGDGTVSLIC